MKPGPHELAKHLPRNAPKERPHPAKRDADTKQLALTFGTLLSSQRSNAHPKRPSDHPRGNLMNTTRTSPPDQPETTIGSRPPSGTRAPPPRHRSRYSEFLLPGSNQPPQVTLHPVQISVGNNEKVTGSHPASQMSRSGPCGVRSTQISRSTTAHYGRSLRTGLL